MAQTLITLDHVEKTLGGRRILDGLSWELVEGECAVILGPSGGGKSVFLQTLMRFIAPDAGYVATPGLEGGDLFAHAAVIFQEDALLESRSVEANLALAVEENIDAIRPPFSPETEAAIDAALRARDEGLPAGGYFLWPFMDNFE